MRISLRIFHTRIKIIFLTLSREIAKNSGFLSRVPDTLNSENPRPATLAELLKATQTLKSQTIITLATALQQPGVFNPGEIAMLVDEDPQLLRSRSSERVERLVMTSENWHPLNAWTRWHP